jgi:hypothetical protein
LIYETNDGKFEEEGQRVFNEASELKKIFSSILVKSE